MQKEDTPARSGTKCATATGITSKETAAMGLDEEDTATMEHVVEESGCDDLAFCEVSCFVVRDLGSEGSVDLDLGFFAEHFTFPSQLR